MNHKKELLRSLWVLPTLRLIEASDYNDLGIHRYTVPQNSTPLRHPL